MKNRTRRRNGSLPRVVALALVATAASWLIAPAASAGGAAPTMARVNVVHAVPDLIVDVYVDDALFLEDFAPGTITGPVKLPAGTYDIEITPADSDTVALSYIATLAGGDRVSLVAHLDEEGSPALTPFNDPKRRVDRSRSVITVRHVAAAPEVDVRVKLGRRPQPWTTAVEDLGNGEQATRTVKVGRLRADVVLAGTDTRAIGPATLMMAPQQHTYVYAWGSAGSGYGFLVERR